MLRITKAMLGLATLALASQTQAADGPIRIGTLFSTTGVVGFIGDPEQKSVEQYVKAVNDAGGVIGRKIELVSFDDASDPARANTFTKRLIESEKVDLIIGGSITPIAMAMIPLVERSETPYISVGGGLPIVDPVKKWVFKTPHTDRQVARRLLQDMKERGIGPLEPVDITSHFQGETRHAHRFLAVPYDQPRGNCAAYFPEANVLVPIGSFADVSLTPTSKSVLVTVQPSA